MPIIHSPEDEIVPFDHGRRLFDAAGKASDGLHKEFLETRGDHNGGFADSGDLYADGFTGFVDGRLRDGGAEK